MITSIEKLRSDIRYETRKFFIQALVAVAVVVGATVTLMNWLGK